MSPSQAAGGQSWGRAHPPGLWGLFWGGWWWVTLGGCEKGGVIEEKGKSGDKSMQEGGAWPDRKVPWEGTSHSAVSMAETAGKARV
jgi:hypothetical protein